MNKELQGKTGSFFVHEWLIYFMVDKTIQRWLSHNNYLDNISILIPYCGSGAFTQLVIEYLLVQFKHLYPTESNHSLLKNIIEKNIHSWDVNASALDICKNRIYNIFGVNPVLKNTSTLLEIEQFDIILGLVPRGDLLSNDFKFSISSEYNEISLDFINWSLKSIHPNGEICLLIPEYLSHLPEHSSLRKSFYDNLTLHHLVRFPQSFTTSYPSLIVGLSHHKNYSIDNSSFINFSEINLSTEDFFDKQNYYTIKK